MYHRFSLIIAALWMMTGHAATGRINSANGLSNDQVLSLAIDGQGYVWVATEAGVNRIAGKTCQAFPLTEQVTDHRISSLHWHEATSQMLIGTERGLTLYNPATGIVRQLTADDGLKRSSIEDIATTGKDVWLVYGNGDVQRLDPQTLTSTTLKQANPKRNRCALDDGKGHLYLGHNRNGMSIINLNSGTTSNYQHQQGEARSIPGNNVRQIYQDNMRRIWVGTDGGLALFDPQSGTFTKVTGQTDEYDDNVYDIRQTSDGMLWVATDIGGIRILDPSQRPADGKLHFTDAKIALSSKNTRAIVQDEFDNIWVGSHSTGVDFISARKSDFALLDYKDSDHMPIPVFSIVKDPKKGFWMASESELSHWQGTQMDGRWSAQHKMRREYTYPRCLMADHTGRIWIGVDDQGIFRLDPSSKQLQHIPITPDGSDIHSFHENADGSVWIGAELGVYLYRDGKATRHEAISKTIGAPATCILTTAPTRLFIATLGDGVYSFDIATGKSRHLSIRDSLPSGTINQVVRDTDGRGLWLATDGGLVYLADPISLTGISVYGQKQGLADRHIRALQQDTNGRIWLSSSSGISYFVKSTRKFYNYIHSAIQHLNGFSTGAAITGDDGTLYFASASGVSYFDPRRIDEQMQVTDVQIISCEAYNPTESTPNAMNALTPCIPDDKGRIITSYEHNTLRLRFTVRNYAQTEQTDYSYMMKGMDDKWYDNGNDHDVVFRGLRPGHYTFILRAKLHSQDWEDAKETRLDITITPPFWRTWWAWLLYAVCLALAVYWLIRQYKRRLTLRNTIELERREHQQKQELNEERLRFFTNITHELRTPLTLILGPLEDLKDDRELPPTARRRVAMIQKSAERLRSLINEILEFRKTETQNRRLTVARGDIGQFVREICLNYKELYRNPKVQFSYDIADHLPNIYFDSEVITTILNNLLSNAIKYTEQGSIITTVKKDSDTSISISVSDTGYGITPEALPHIFERYYQAKGSHQASGTGIGLALAKSLAELHEGRLTVESHQSLGSRFTLTLSADNTYPGALHKEDTAVGPLQQDGIEKLTQEAPDDDTEEQEKDDQLPLLLVVEDNADIRQYISDTFSEDFTILEAADGEQGVQMALEHTPDIIVSDIMMPRLNGIQLTRQLKNDLRTSHIPIILLTAKTTDDDKLEGYDSGADSYLTKPFTARLLASRIQNLLTARRRLAEMLKTGHGDRLHDPSLGQEPDPTTLPGIDSHPSISLSHLDREFLERLNRTIEDNIMQTDIDMAFLTDRMAMSHSTFYRKVKALTGLTAKEYVRKRRLQHCYQLIESGDYNVTEAAMMTGFNQMAHFREVFKHEFGILPSEVKRN